MTLRAIILAIGPLLAAVFTVPAIAEETTAIAEQSKSSAEKLNAYIECLNRLSERSYESRARYFEWVNPKKGPTGKERIIYGTYTIYDTADCKEGVEKANALEPHDAQLEAAASGYVEAVVALEPLLKEADDYYEQENYKDDKMAKGKELHPRLVAAWAAFAAADVMLRDEIEAIQSKQQAEELVAIEKAEGRKARYHIQALMLRAKALMRLEGAEKPDLEKIKPALAEYEDAAKAIEAYAAADKDSKIGSSFIGDAKSYLTTAKQLMRRMRDKVPYSQGERMILDSGGGGWMVEGSPPRLVRDYNQLIESYNRGANF